MTTMKLAGASVLALIIFATADDAGARSRSKDSREIILLKQKVARQDAQLAQFSVALAILNAKIAPDAAPLNAMPMPPRNPLIAAPMPTPLPDAGAVKVAAPHVYPVTGTQGGQFGDNRPGHRHAGIDIRAPYGSPVVAVIGGRVLPPPGRGRGYGPRFVEILGLDRKVHRYAHLSRLIVRVGQSVETGQRIGSVGPTRGPHLHYEVHRWATYPRHPYGLKSALNPNDYLGGRRGARMVAGNAMTGEAARAYALRFAPAKVAEAP